MGTGTTLRQIINMTTLSFGVNSIMLWQAAVVAIVPDNCHPSSFHSVSIYNVFLYLISVLDIHVIPSLSADLSSCIS